VYDESHDAPFRFPVQLVARHNGHEANDFRGYMGRIEAGKVGGRQAGGAAFGPERDRQRHPDAGRFAPVGGGRPVDHPAAERIPRHLARRPAGQRRQPATQLKQLKADVCWMSDEPLDLRRKYWIKHGTKQTSAKVKAIESLLDINTQQRHSAEGLKLNDIATIELSVQQPLAADAYSDIRATGAFILIDEVTHQTRPSLLV
jgi:sulfate adenylyltransferase subunit 1